MLYRGYAPDSSDELQHYGVLGMKWGVRRSARVLANHRKNQSVKSAKQMYKKKQITKEERNSQIQKAKQTKKDDIKAADAQYKNAKGRKAKKQLSVDLKNKTRKEVPHSTIKRGIGVVNHLLTVGKIGSDVVGTGIAVATMPPLAGLALTSLAGSVVMNVGREIVVDQILDRVS